MKWLAIWASFLAGCLVVSLAGCGIDTSKNLSVKANQPKISSVLVDVIAFPESESYMSLLLHFEDGYVLKCRTYNFDVLLFRKGVVNKIYLDDTNRIQLVEIENSAVLPEKN